MKKTLLMALCLLTTIAHANRLLVISSGLGMYGNDDGINLGVEKMGVDTYLSHANTNSTGAFTLPILLKNLKRNKSWANAGIQTYKDYAKSVLDSVQNLFEIDDTSENACLKGVILDQLVNPMGYDISFSELCFEKARANVYKLKWKLNSDSPFKMRTHVKVGDIDELIKVVISNRGQIKFKIKNNGKVKIRIRGIQVNINGFKGEGKGKIFSLFRHKGINIFNNIRAKGKISFFGIPLSAGVDAQDISDIDMIDVFKRFGFRIHI
jgi:hypothetical protein